MMDSGKWLKSTYENTVWLISVIQFARIAAKNSTRILVPSTVNCIKVDLTRHVPQLVFL